ncbi:MAG: hypothetical protein ACYCTI_03815 [Acidimicrobiales bacterium]
MSRPDPAAEVESPGGTPVAASETDPARTEDAPEAERWVPLKEAAEAAGITVSALRKAYREDRIDSTMGPGPTGPQRLVGLGQVLERMGPGKRGLQTVRAALAAPGTVLPGAGPAGEYLPVPRAAWESLLEQVGNLHQAGQELAEARERAAKAETANDFLKEQLAEARARVAAAEGPSDRESRPKRRWFRA